MFIKHDFETFQFYCNPRFMIPHHLHFMPVKKVLLITGNRASGKNVLASGMVRHLNSNEWAIVVVQRLDLLPTKIKPQLRTMFVRHVKLKACNHENGLKEE